MRLKRLYPGSLVKPTVSTMLVPRPTTARVAGTPLRDQAILRWAEDVIDAVLGGSVAAAASVAQGPSAAAVGQPVGSAR
jgi:transcription-repair coupling factor (superfamily II helicase)